MGDREKDAPTAGKEGKAARLVKKKRKHLGQHCDKDCEVCRTRCENPVYPPRKP